jgi:hypothetical protein
MARVYPAPLACGGRDPGTSGGLRYPLAPGALLALEFYAVKGFHWKMMALGFVLAGLGLHVPYIELWGVAVLIVILFAQMMRPRRNF